MVDYRTILEEPAKEMLDEDDIPEELDRETVSRVAFRNAEKEDYVNYLRETHGDIEDPKTKFLFIAEEEDFNVEGEDIEAITEEPPTATFT